MLASLMGGMGGGAYQSTATATAGSGTWNVTSPFQVGGKGNSSSTAGEPAMGAVALGAGSSNVTLYILAGLAGLALIVAAIGLFRK